ncbi:TetR/AcrR family transcriptional regulator [Kribbella deserti]|uniref:TetR/AcrR family transcriptional regulator n=1 Tax=Kribbella deserti TaxID=1926257 RepID=A0ABV6QJG6_9ACTN
MTEPATRRYSGRSVDEWKAARRERLMEAAFELFGTEGYTSTSVERLCAHAKVSTRHFYHEFPNKEAVLLAAHKHIMETGVQGTTAALAEHMNDKVPVRVRSAVDAYLRMVMSDLRRAQLSFVEVVGISPALEHQRLAYREMLVATVVHIGETGVARGEISPKDFRFLGLSFIGAVNTVVYDWMVCDPRPPADEVREALINLGLSLMLD